MLMALLRINYALAIFHSNPPQQDIGDVVDDLDSAIASTIFAS
jgi:hypothetical protein